MASVIRIPNPEGHKRLENALKLARAKNVRVGWFDSARYEDGTPVAYVASIQEFGYVKGNIPPRLGMRTTAAEKGAPGGEWSKVAYGAARAVIDGSLGPNGMMDLIGLKASGDFAKHIAEVQEPPLKSATIKARQRRYANRKIVGNLYKPLVATGTMISTLTYVVGIED